MKRKYSHSSNSIVFLLLRGTSSVFHFPLCEVQSLTFPIKDTPLWVSVWNPLHYQNSDIWFVYVGFGCLVFPFSEVFLEIFPRIAGVCHWIVYIHQWGPPVVSLWKTMRKLPMNLALDNLSVRPPLVRIVFLGEPMNLLSIPARARIGTGREFAYRSRVFRALRFNSLSH